MSTFVTDGLAEFDLFVESFEAAHQRGEQPRIVDYLPADDDRLFTNVLCELVRIDMEYGWCAGRPCVIEHYLQQFPQLAGQTRPLREILFEEYRLRQMAGEEPDADEYVARFGINPLDGHGAVGNGPDVDRKMWRMNGGANSHHCETPDESVWPVPGARVLSFGILKELGRGAFGRVYLARQGDLADRLVCLKFSTSFFNESQILARLQHTNIVPIYSVHGVDPFQIVCMPYCGGAILTDLLHNLRQCDSLPDSGKHFVTTLRERGGLTLRAPESHTRASSADATAAVAPDEKKATWTKLQGMSYVDAALWLVGRLADGLGHAHELGIIHRDIKPANILLTDDGQPMLLDFNLSAPVAADQRLPYAVAGGTLPYMAPQQLQAFQAGDGRNADVRDDLYSLGLIFFELLTGRPAFRIPSASGDQLITQMLVDRGHPPRVRENNRDVPPAVDAIVARCLAFDAAHRYQSARELQDDIDRQLNHRPLQHAREPMTERLGKWRRRHPRLTSAGTVAIVALTLLLTAGWALANQANRARERDAREQFHEFQIAANRLQTGLIRTPEWQRYHANIDEARAWVDRYGVGSDKWWAERPIVTSLSPADQERLGNRLGEVLFLLAHAVGQTTAGAEDAKSTSEAWQFNELARTCFRQTPRAYWQQRAELARLREDPGATEYAEIAAHTPPGTPTDRYFVALRAADDGRLVKAVDDLQHTVNDDPTHFWAWMLLGNCQYHLGHDTEAAAAYSICTSLEPKQAQAFYNRGLVHFRQGKLRDALVDFDQALRLEPDNSNAHIGRALVRERLRQFDKAEEDLTAVINDDNPPTRAFFLRGRVRDHLSKKVEAKADRDEALRREPSDDNSYITRGLARMKADPKGALADFQAAERINPRSYHALQNQAAVLSENLDRPEDSLKVLEKLLAMYPEWPKGLAGRAILLARMNRVDDAVKDAKRCLELAESDPFIRYQIAGVFARTAQQPGHFQKAMSLLAESVLKGEGAKYIFTDPDLAQIRDRQEFKDLLTAVRTLTTAAGK